MTKRGVFIYRPLQEPDECRIREIQDNLSEVETFQPVEDLHLTLLDRDATRKVKLAALSEVVYPLPEAAATTYSLDVEDIELYRPGVKRAIYYLGLKDDESRFHDEHATFTQRANKLAGTYRHLRQPHVTLGYSDCSFATDATIEDVKGLLPKRVRFGQIAIEPEIEEPYVYAAPNDTTPPLDPGLVTRIRPGTIPADFLAKLRQSYPQAANGSENIATEPGDQA